VAGHRQEIVVDSSVAVKWFSDEEDTDKALVLRDQHLKGTRQVWVHELLYYEVANALRFKRTFDETKHGEAVNSLFAFHLNNWPVDSLLLRNATEMAYRCGASVYDTVPVALAAIRKTICVTADEETQYKKLKAHRFPVVLLSEETF
jgi:predicted nucleic acid-binding protein